jgi:Lipocalin-like domain
MKDGSKLEVFAANPKCTFIIEANGHFATIITRPDLPKVGANDRLKPTPEEALAIARGMIAYFGTYTVDEANKSMMLRIEGTTFPNQLGVEQKRVITSISADELNYNNPSILGEAVVGGELVWKRVK